MWQLGRDTSHVPAGLDCPRGGRLEIDQDPEGQSRGYMYDKQFLPYCRYRGIVLTGIENCFQQSDRLQYMCVKDFIHIVLANKCPRITCYLYKSNEPLHYHIGGLLFLSIQSIL